MTPTIEAHRLTKRFGKTSALDGLEDDEKVFHVTHSTLPFDSARPVRITLQSDPGSFNAQQISVSGLRAQYSQPRRMETDDWR